MAEFKGKVKKIVIEPGEKFETPECFLLVEDNDNKNGFGEIKVVTRPVEEDFKLTSIVKLFSCTIQVNAPNITKNGVVRLDDPETFLTFL